MRIRIQCFLKQKNCQYLFILFQESFRRLGFWEADLHLWDNNIGVFFIFVSSGMSLALPLLHIGHKAFSVPYSYGPVTSEGWSATQRRKGWRRNRRSVSALSTGVYRYNTTLLVMVDRVKDEGCAPPTLTRLGWYYHDDGMYARKWPLLVSLYSLICVLQIWT